MTYTLSDVSKLEFDGAKRFEYVERDRDAYRAQRNAWRYQYRVELPAWSLINEFGRPKDLRLLCCKLNIYLKFSNTSWMNFLFKPGFVTDLASVPRPLRGIVDNDEHQIVTAALVHDFAFVTRRLPFRLANGLFYKILRYNRYNRLKALLAYWAVSSFVGRRHYRTSAGRIERELWTNEHCDMQLSRPIEWHGKMYK